MKYIKSKTIGKHKTIPSFEFTDLRTFTKSRRSLKLSYILHMRTRLRWGNIGPVLTDERE